MLASDNKFSFANDEVAVTIPAGMSARLKAVSRDVGAVDMQPAEHFRPIRVVANIVIEDESQPGNALTDLGGQVSFKVKYRASDLEAADKKPLVLAFWDGKGWVPLTSAKHGFKLTAYTNPNNGGYATFSLTRWGDPPISWGT